MPKRTLALALTCAALLSAAPEALAQTADHLTLSVAGFRIRRPCDGVVEILAGRTMPVTANASRAVDFKLMKAGVAQPLAAATVVPKNGIATWSVRYPHTGRHAVVATLPSEDPALVITKAQVVDVVWPNAIRSAGWVKLAVPYYRQQHRLSCEAATLRMAHNYFWPGRVRSDLQVHSLTGVDPRRPNVRGGCDPDRAFCGDVNAYMFQGGYGVHDAPIAAAATKLSPCRPGLRLAGVVPTRLALYLDLGYPVVLWGAHAGIRSGVMPVRWVAWTGRTVTAWNVEHTWLVIGFHGSIANPTTFLIHDPKQGTRTVTASQLAAFARPFRTAVVVRG